MDLVLNHSSDEHPWFLEAKKSRDNPYHDYYVWRDGVEGIYPNDLKAGFGGPAWQWVPECGQYYLHQFSVKQPDLNWDNPKVREEIYKMIQWWVDRGIGGFRLDVIDKIAKEPDRMVMEEGTMLHPYLKEMSKAVFQQKELVTVGEAWSATPERALLYSNPDGSELSMVFQFEHILLDQQPGKEKWDLAPLPFVQFKESWQSGRRLSIRRAGTASSLKTTTCPDRFPVLETTEGTGWNLPKCWPPVFTECRVPPTSTRARKSA